MAFLLPKQGYFALFLGLIAKIQDYSDGFRPYKPFFFLTIKYNSFTLYPYRSIDGVLFNL